MAEYTTLVNLLHTVSDDPIEEAIKSILEAIESEPDIVSGHIGNATLRHWAKAIHTSRLDSLSHSELVEGLEFVGKFHSQEIRLESLNYFLDVTVHIDTDAVIKAFNLNGKDSSINLNSSIGDDTKQEKKSDSLSLPKSSEKPLVNELPPNKTIDWNFISKNEKDTIQLKTFYMSSMYAAPDLKAGVELKENDEDNRYKSHEVYESTNENTSYWFDFTINNGTQLFKFDPLVDED